MSNAFSNPAFEGSPTTSIRSPSPPSQTERNLVVDQSLEMEEVSTFTSPDNKGTNGTTAYDLSAVENEAALCVRNAYKTYQKGNPVLTDFNMTVPAGSIYSLLGSSGCGKSTLLTCCVNLRNLDKGTIRIFGHSPGSKESGVPGRKVGYMPQELSLYNELTIQEALNLYGRIYGMKQEQLQESTAFLIDFLDLPKASRRIGSLSGGQKRRVSMALTLIHDPELLILDEPTVGVDPLLRESIWNHLVKLVQTGRNTVIITTHYVDEARQSDMIGIMRNGRLLAEKSPSDLITEFNVGHLEDIVVTLCRMDREMKKKNKPEKETESPRFSSLNFSSFLKRKLGKVEPAAIMGKGNVLTLRYETSSPPPPIPTITKSSMSSIISNDSTQTVFDAPNRPCTKESDTTSPAQKLTESIKAGKGYLRNMALLNKRRLSTREVIQMNHSTSFQRLTALLIKNFILLMRNIGFLLFIFLVPAIQVVLICLTIGSDPKGLLLSVVNPESCDFEKGNWRSIGTTCPVNFTMNEEDGALSCFYLSVLPKESFILERVNSSFEALERIQTGYTYGYIQFPHEYTKNVLCRFGGAILDCGSTEEVTSGSDIILELDMSNKQIGQTMKRIFVDTYGETMDRIKSNCETNLLDSVADLPYTFKKPLYGKDDTSFREFLAPSILLGLLFFFPLCSSGVSYITEKKAGTLDRALVAGVGTTELMGGFLISQVGILIGQAGFAFLILTQVFQIEILGSISLALSLTILVGISGMSAGFLIAMFCSEEVQAVLLAIGTFFPNILLAGMVWPLEGMDRGLQYISYLLPCTLACESMRSIISRGWALDHRSVWPGFLSTLAWIVVYWTLAVLVHKLKSRG